MLARNKDDLIAFANGAAKVAGALQTFYIIYDKFTGTKYSDSECRVLDTLKQTYKDCLQTESPVQWELDDKRCPTHRIKSSNWSRYCRELKKKIGGTVLYYHQMKVIAKVAAAYLEQRGIRSLGSGTSGDVLEQFISEWIHFALTELPTLGDDDESIEKINRRINYIRSVDTHEAIFKYGTVDRAKTKFDVFDDIEEQLIICKKRALVERSRVCAREQFHECRTTISSLLTDCADVIFYARGTAVQDTALDLARYVNANRLRKRTTDTVYEKIRETHTGRMLFDVITHAGLSAFDADITQVEVNSSDYFDENYQLKAFDIQQYTNDLFPWIVGEDAERNQLQLIQELCQTLLRIARLKELIETALDLTGDCGNLWAYDDKEGKNSLSGMLFLMERECDLLKSHFDTLYEDNREARKEYSRLHKIDANKGANPNFTEVDILSGQILERIKRLKHNISSLRQQMNDYPGDALEQINKKKQQFYQSLNQFIQRFCPEHFEVYGIQALAEASTKAEGEIVENEPHPDLANKVVKINIEKLKLLQIPLQCSIGNPEYFYLNKPEFLAHSCQDIIKPAALKRQADWCLGQDYHDWTHGYFQRHHSDYRYYQQYCQALSQLTYTQEELETIKQLQKDFQQQMTVLQSSLARERPRWRFKWSLWPIKTKGWPFNQKAAQFAELLTQELTRWDRDIQSITHDAIQRITEINNDEGNRFIPPDQFKEQHPADFLEPAAEPLIAHTMSSQAHIIDVLQQSAETMMLIDETLRDENLSQPSTTENDSTSSSESPQLEALDEISETFDQFNAWHHSVIDLLKTCKQEQFTVPFQLFSNLEEVKTSLQTMLALKDQLDTDLAEIISGDCYSLKLTLQTMNTAFTHDTNSQSQIEMVLQLLSILITPSDAKDRQQLIESFFKETIKSFAQQKLRQQIQGDNHAYKH